MISITVPGSKSETNRALLMAAMTHNTVTINNYCICEDSGFMIEGLRALGVEINEIDKQTVTVKGVNGNFTIPTKPINVGNAGTTTRFLIAAACLLKENVVLMGNEYMAKRPNDHLIMALKSLGADIFQRIVPGKYVEFMICGKNFRGGRVELPGNISSQFITALMIIAPMLEDGIEIQLTEDLLSRPYVDLTIKSLKLFNIDWVKSDFRHIYVKGNQKYAREKYKIFGDASAASYWFAWSMMHKKPISINVTEHSGQGDYYFIDVMERMRATYEIVDENIHFFPPQTMQTYAGDLATMPDVVPTLAAFSATLPGITHINNIEHLRYKECDRLNAVVENLNTLGVETEVIETKNQTDLVVHGTQKPLKGMIKTYDDHRIAMAFGILTSKHPEIIIDNKECVAKSYTHFWEDLESMNKQLKKD